MTQLTIFQAIEAGQQGMTRAAKRAQAADPMFAAKAENAILSHLRANGPCSGEALTDIARAHGARAKDDRAMGPVFQKLLRKKLVFVMGYAPRAKGHGCMGAKVYALQN
jgi:hypothetical protein